MCVQEQPAESENEANENMGRVDEGVEEFFTKKIIPDDPLWVHNNINKYTKKNLHRQGYISFYFVSLLSCFVTL